MFTLFTSLLTLWRMLVMRMPRMKMVSTNAINATNPFNATNATNAGYNQEIRISSDDGELAKILQTGWQHCLHTELIYLSMKSSGFTLCMTMINQVEKLSMNLRMKFEKFDFSSAIPLKANSFSSPKLRKKTNCLKFQFQILSFWFFCVGFL